MARLVILRLLDSYFRHRWLNLMPFVLMLALGGASFYLAEPQYTSRGRLYVQKSSLLPSLTQIGNDGFSWQSPTQIVASELSELVQTEAFVRSVIQKTDLEANMSAGPQAVQKTIDDFRKALSVQMVGDNVIEISAKSKSPQLAQQLTSATIEAYSAWKLNGDRQESAVAQSFFADVLPGYQQELQRARDEMQTYLKSHPEKLRGERPPEEVIEIGRLQAAVDTAAKRVESAMEKEESARLAQAQAESSVRQNYLLIDAPSQPTQPEASLRDRVTGPVIFGVVGLLLSFGGIIGGALLDRSFRFSLDVRNSLELPVLALVPDVSQVVQPPVVNEPTLAHSQAKQRNEYGPPAIAQLTHKRRRARQQIPTTTEIINGNGLADFADGSAILPDQTTA
jgi:uncharacterized protein involved in exopolysaccharide biosynthesis